MRAAGTHLHVVSPAHEPGRARRDLADLGLSTMLFAVSLAPLACDAAGLGRWDGSTLGLGTVGVLVWGRELVHELGALRWRRP